MPSSPIVLAQRDHCQHCRAFSQTSMVRTVVMETIYKFRIKSYSSMR